MMKIVFLFLLSLAFSAEVLAQAKVSLRSEDLKTLVERRNEKVQGKIKEIQGAEEREGSLWRSFLPKAEITAAQEKFKKGSRIDETQPAYGAELSVNLFNGGRDKLEDKRRTLTLQRKGFEGAQVLSTELEKARDAYWRILYLRDYLMLLENARKNIAESLKAAERRISSGVATETDRVEFQMQEVDLKREFENAELAQKNQIRVLSLVLGLDPEAIEFPEELKHEHDWESALNHTEADHAFLVKPAELQALEAEAQATSQKRSWLPKVDAYAAYNQLNQRHEEDYSDSSERQESVIGVRMTMSLFDGFNGHKEGKALMMESEALKAEARYAQKEIEAHLHGEIAELKLLHNQVHEAEENIKRGEKYLRLTQSEYSRGVKNSPDMLGATEKLISMQQKRLEIIRDFQIAKSHVLSKIGR